MLCRKPYGPAVIVIVLISLISFFPVAALAGQYGGQMEAAVSTFPTATYQKTLTNTATLDMGTVPAGAIFLLHGSANINYSTAPTVVESITGLSSGTAAFSCGSLNATQIYHHHFIPAATPVYVNISFVCIVNTAGTLIVKNLMNITGGTGITYNVNSITVTRFK
jgi:hypothetical protein